MSSDAEIRLQRYYVFYNPNNIEKIPEILEAYHNNIDEIFADLVDVYGPEPDDTIAVTDVRQALSTEPAMTEEPKSRSLERLHSSRRRMNELLYKCPLQTTLGLSEENRDISGLKENEISTPTITVCENEQKNHDVKRVINGDHDKIYHERDIRINSSSKIIKPVVSKIDLSNQICQEKKMVNTAINTDASFADSKHLNRRYPTLSEPEVVRWNVSESHFITTKPTLWRQSNYSAYPRTSYEEANRDFSHKRSILTPLNTSESRGILTTTLKRVVMTPGLNEGCSFTPASFRVKKFRPVAVLDPKSNVFVSYNVDEGFTEKRQIIGSDVTQIPDWFVNVIERRRELITETPLRLSDMVSKRLWSL